jgi:hypothetical protein
LNHWKSADGRFLGV